MAIHRLPQPVIAQVHGIATAAGCQLVAACDLAIASEEARFATPGVRIGLFCSTPMVEVSRSVGRKRALEMLLTGEMIDATTAADWGLVNRVVPARAAGAGDARAGEPHRRARARTPSRSARWRSTSSSTRPCRTPTSTRARSWRPTPWRPTAARASTRFSSKRDAATGAAAKPVPQAQSRAGTTARRGCPTGRRTAAIRSGSPSVGRGLRVTVG